MSITDTISQTAASNPVVGAAVSASLLDSTLLSGMESGDSATTNLLSAVYNQSSEINTLMSQLEPNLGQNVNTTA
jgi:hypothetical protein